MKQKIIYSVLILIIILSSFHISFASTNTLYRPSDTLGITKKIELTSERKNLIQITPYVDATEKIYDFANLFTNNEENELYNKVQDFITTYNMDMIIVTIDENNKKSAMHYADDFYDYNDFGIGNSYDGILFLIDMDNRIMWISTTGDRIIRIYSDSDIDSILDNCYSYISNEKYYDCANAFITSSIDTYVSYEKSSFWMGLIAKILFIGGSSLLIPTVFCLVKKSKHKNIKLATTANEYLDKSSINITHSADKFIRTHTTQTRRESSSSGSSTHSGSSGISHGGGGRSF